MKRLILLGMLMPTAAWGQDGSFSEFADVVQPYADVARSAGLIVGCDLRPSEWGDEVQEAIKNKANAALENRFDVEDLADFEEQADGLITEAFGDSETIIPSTTTCDVITGEELTDFDALIGWKP